MATENKVVYKNIGERIKRVRNRKGLTEKECARALGISTTQYIYCESDQRRFSIVQLEKLAQLFHYPIGHFIGESTSKDPLQIWEAALRELQIQINKSNYRIWLEKTTGLSYQEDRFVIGAPNAFVAEYLDKEHRALITEVLAGIIQDKVEVCFDAV